METAIRRPTAAKTAISFHSLVMGVRASFLKRHYWSLFCVIGRSFRRMEGISHGLCELFGQDLRFFRQASCTRPVTCFYRFAGILEEALNLGHQIGLRRVQSFSARGRKVFFGDVQGLARFLPRGSRLFRRE